MKKVKVELSLSAFVAQSFLSALRTNVCDLFIDPQFRLAFEELEGRVYELVDAKIDGEIIDTYVIVEGEVTGDSEE